MVYRRAQGIYHNDSSCIDRDLELGSSMASSGFCLTVVLSLAAGWEPEGAAVATAPMNERVPRATTAVLPSGAYPIRWRPLLVWKYTVVVVVVVRRRGA